VWSQVLDRSFPKTRRLLRAGDYGRVFDNAHAKASHKYLLLLAIRNDGPGHRLGLVIAKKNVRLAVQRNRIKRIAREVFRSLPESEPAMDVVLLTRRGIDQLDNAELSSILQQQWRKLSRDIPKPESTTNRDR
jgi:ribonuclease P protein component